MEEELLDAVVYALEDVLEFAARVAGDAAGRSPWWRRHGQADQAGVRKRGCRSSGSSPP